MEPAFAPPPGIRFPTDVDRALAFEAAGSLKGRLTFEEILDYHDPPAAHFTLLRMSGRRLAGAVCFKLREQDVFIDYLTRNDWFVRRGVPVGTNLVRAVEDFARLHGRDVVRLDAMQDAPLIAWYARFGFAPEGPPHDEPGWGTLLPMAKRVSAPSPP